jgi:hypothetical protein
MMMGFILFFIFKKRRGLMVDIEKYSVVYIRFPLTITKSYRERERQKGEWQKQ